MPRFRIQRRPKSPPALLKPAEVEEEKIDDSEMTETESNSDIAIEECLNKMSIDSPKREVRFEPQRRPATHSHRQDVSRIPQLQKLSLIILVHPLSPI